MLTINEHEFQFNFMRVHTIFVRARAGYFRLWVHRVYNCAKNSSKDLVSISRGTYFT